MTGRWGTLYRRDSWNGLKLKHVGALRVPTLFVDAYYMTNPRL